MNFSSNFQPPWQAAGTDISNCETLTEVCTEYGLEWTVDRHALFYRDSNGSERSIGNKVAHVRSDNSQFFGITSDSYVSIQNTQCFETFQPLLEEGELELDVVGVSGGGKQVWIVGKLSSIETGSDFPETPPLPYVVLAWGHAGASTLAWMCTPVRPSCANMLTLARGHQLTKMIRVVHKRNALAGLQGIRDCIDATQGAFSATVDAYLRLIDTPVNMDQARAYIQVAFGFNDEQMTSGKKEAALALSNYVMNGDLTTAGTLWGAYNGVTHYLTHQYGKGDSFAEGKALKRFEALTFGPNKARGQVALDSAIKLSNDWRPTQVSMAGV